MWLVAALLDGGVDGTISNRLPCGLLAASSLCELSCSSWSSSWHAPDGMLLVSVSYCWITSCHKLSHFQQHPFVILIL